MKKVITLAALVLIFCTGCKYFEKKRLFSKGADTMLNYAAELEEPAKSDTSEMNVAPGDIRSEENLSPEDLHSMYKKNESLGSNRIYMIVGCFLIPQNADNYAEKIRKMGYNSEIILRPDGFHMVTANSYDNLKAGVRDLQKFRGEITQNAWVWIKK